MTTDQDSLRTDQVSRVILAPPRAIYRAHLDAELMANWRAPNGMRAEILAFDGRLGGHYRMALHYQDADGGRHGKSDAGVDRFTGTFSELVPDEKIVELIQFETDNPDFAQPMIITTMLRPVRDGTKVTVECKQVSPAISADDHVQGITTSLRKLAMLTE